jgi:hypothetical protein
MRTMAEQNPSKIENGINACLTALWPMTENPVEAFTILLAAAAGMAQAYSFSEECINEGIEVAFNGTYIIQTKT